MAGRAAWRMGRALCAVDVRFRALSSAANQKGPVDVVEKVATRMLAQREALLQNVGASTDACRSAPQGSLKKLKIWKH